MDEKESLNTVVRRNASGEVTASAEQKERRKMRWYSNRGKHLMYSPMGRYFVRLENGTSIEVHPARYHQEFQRYLDHLGVQRTTWSEIMKKAEEEWAAYCHIMDQFAQDTEQWLNCQESDVFVEFPQREEN